MKVKDLQQELGRFDPDAYVIVGGRVIHGLNGFPASTRINIDSDLSDEDAEELDKAQKDANKAEDERDELKVVLENILEKIQLSSAVTSEELKSLNEEIVELINDTI